MNDSIYTKIIRREIPAEIIYEDEHTVVFPDRFPSMEGQLLVITKRQVPYVFDLSDDEYRALMETTRKMSKALDRAFKTERTCMVIEGFEVPHVHVRLYPCTTAKLTWAPRTEAPDETLREVAEKIKEALG